MSWSDLAGLRTVAALSWRDFRTVYPLRIRLASSLPRAVMQVLFVAYLGQFAGGVSGREFALIGAGAQVVTITTIVKAGDVLLEDRQLGTLYRLRLSRFPLPLVAATRWWIFVGEGVLEAMIAIAVVGAFFGRPGLVVDSWAVAAVIALIALSTSALGMATAAAAMTARAELLIVNLVSYLLLALTGAVAPLDRLPAWLATAAHGLPMTNGLLAIRAALAGQRWWPPALAEVAVGAGWLGVACLLLTVQSRRARAADTDDKW